MYKSTTALALDALRIFFKISNFGPGWLKTLINVSSSQVTVSMSPCSALFCRKITLMMVMKVVKKIKCHSN